MTDQGWILNENGRHADAIEACTPKLLALLSRINIDEEPG